MIRSPDLRINSPCGTEITSYADFHVLEVAWRTYPRDAVDTLVQTWKLEGPPRPGHAIGGESVVLFWPAPRRWWLRSERVVTPAPIIQGLAVTEISDATACFEIRGDSSRQWVMQFSPADLRPKNFRPSQVTWTRFAYTRALLHCRLDDALDVYVGRSVAHDIIKRCTSG